MAKVMLVEDDNNLREVYEDRLKAEGYDIVSAHDGEEALAVAVKEKPDLIITDIMMPKISGFDMLDILRSTPETKDTKIVMMTALSQTEDKERAGKLGADKYLVKSQVTLEDIVRVAKEMIDGEGAVAVPAQDAATPTDAQSTATPTPAQQADVPVAQPPADDQQDQALSDDTAAVTPEPTATDDSSTQDEDATDDTASPTPEPTTSTPTPEPTPAESTPTPDSQPETPTPAPAPASSVEEQIKDFITATEQNKETPAQPETPTPAPAPASSATSIPVTDMSDTAETTPASPTEQPEGTPAPEAPEPTTGQKKVIEPINDLNAPGPDLNALMEKENAKPADTDTPIPSVNTVISPDGTLSYATPPEDQNQASAPTETAQAMSADAPAKEQPESQPPQAGDKIDPNIAL